MKIAVNKPVFTGNYNIEYYRKYNELKPVEKRIKNIINQNQVDLYIAKGYSQQKDESGIYLFRAIKNPHRSDKTYGVQVMTRYKSTTDTEFQKDVVNTVNKVSEIAIKRAGGLTITEKATKYFRKLIAFFG